MLATESNRGSALFPYSPGVVFFSEGAPAPLLCQRCAAAHSRSWLNRGLAASPRPRRMGTRFAEGALANGDNDHASTYSSDVLCNGDRAAYDGLLEHGHQFHDKPGTARR